jgi:hypothetical protein
MHLVLVLALLAGAPPATATATVTPTSDLIYELTLHQKPVPVLEVNLAPLVHEFGWGFEQWDELAAQGDNLRLQISP